MGVPSYTNWSNKDNFGSTDHQNENNSRKSVPSDDSVLDKNIVPSDPIVAESQSKSEINGEPTKVSSSTSVLSKKAIELKFRKQKEHLYVSTIIHHIFKIHLRNQTMTLITTLFKL